MTNISAVIITKNEELNIERCIRSMRGIADEILVVDSFSTDKTEEICKGLEVRFIQHEFQGYGPQKQYAVSEAKYDWILSLDADEELSEELCESIRNVKQKDIDPKAAYSFSRKNYYCKKLIRFVGWGHDTKTRLFNRKFANWSNNLVHETVDTSQLGNVEQLTGDLRHYTYNSVEQHKQKITGYAKLGAMEIATSGKQYSKPVILVKTAYRFLLEYIFKLGFLDGYYGFKISQMDALYVYLKYSGGEK
ncbi:MAG: glycosyltransferase family 2 protein [Paludibacteraceae bacterium]|nr:glycosyltransferase family 2 protein [Paludibacteraceae bacterium]